MRPWLALLPVVALVAPSETQAVGVPQNPQRAAPAILAGPIVRSAVASAPAVRLTPPKPPAPVGLGGRPFAPAGLSDCAEMTFYRKQWGLPSVFDQLGWRESNCRNEDAVRTYCCHGYWQLYISLFLRDPRMKPRLTACGVDAADDVNSDNPYDKQRQACSAKALYDVQGISAWNL